MCLHNRKLFNKTNFEAQNSFLKLGPHFFFKQKPTFKYKIN